MRRLEDISNLSINCIQEMRKDAEVELKKASSRRDQKTAIEAKRWAIDACTGSARAAHKHIKGDETFTDDLNEIKDGQWAVSPLEVMDAKTKRWSELWSARDNSVVDEQFNRLWREARRRQG